MMKKGFEVPEKKRENVEKKLPRKFNKEAHEELKRKHAPTDLNLVAHAEEVRFVEESGARAERDPRRAVYLNRVHKVYGDKAKTHAVRGVSWVNGPMAAPGAVIS